MSCLKIVAELADLVRTQDFSLMGWYRMLYAVAPSVAKEAFHRGQLGEILDRLQERFRDGMAEVLARDPK